MVKYSMLIDEVDVIFKAGDGGGGKVSFGKMAKSGPDGGNGGKGGDIYLEGSSDLKLLGQFHGKNVIEAENGIPGDKKKMAGKFAPDLTILIPFGSTITDKKTKEVFEVAKVGEKILLCEGGKGGVGNFDLRSPSNTTPLNSIPASKGQKRFVTISLKFIADFGLVGLPNSGKSSLLNELTNSKVKTANYAFTTLSANLGVLPNKKIIADIPGIIEGASSGKGLGIGFLKHIQKVKLILHCISAESLDPYKDYKIVRSELQKYDKKMLKKKEVILLTKHDLVDKKVVSKLKTKLIKTKREILETSIYDPESLNKLLNILK
jgi:GTPase